MFASDDILDDDQLRTYLETARTAGDERDRLIGYTLVNTGLRPSEFAHMTADWLELDQNRIRVPGVEECACPPCQHRLEMIREAYPAYEPLVIRVGELARQLVEVKEQASAITDVDELAALEADARDIWARYEAVRELHSANQYRKFLDYASGDAEEIMARYDGVWSPRDPEGERVIPLLDPTTKEYLTEWFASHERIDLSHEEVHLRVQALGEESPLSVVVDVPDLRWAYARRLADMGFSAVEIRAVLGESDLARVERFLKRNSTRVEDMFEQQWEDL